MVTTGLTNFSGNTLTGGTYIVNGASGNTGTMQLSSPAGISVVNNAANIVLNGPTANTLFVNSSNANILAPLTNNMAAGSLTVSGGYALTTVATLNNAGSITIGDGSSITAGSNYQQTAGSTTIAGVLNAANVNLSGGTQLERGYQWWGAQALSVLQMRPVARSTSPADLR